MTAQYKRAVATLRPSVERMKAIHEANAQLERQAVKVSRELIRAYGIDIAYSAARRDRDTNELAREVSVVLLGVKRGTRDPVTAESLRKRRA